MPCAGCGTLMWRSTTSLPEGQARCQPCRRAASTEQYRARTRVIGCATCMRTIETTRSRQRYCSRRCSQRKTVPTAADRARWARKNDRRTARRRNYGRPWRTLRDRVLDEERKCWVCDDEIDRALTWTHPMSGSGDHVVALTDGGQLLDRANVRAAHLTCNVERTRGRRRG